MQIAFSYIEKYEVRFWKRVSVGQEWECWEWLGSRSNGYGMFSTAWKCYPAHVFAKMLLEEREMKLGECVLHLCNNSGCCNPFHTYIGGKIDNSYDLRVKHGNALPLTRHFTFQRLISKASQSSREFKMTKNQLDSIKRAFKTTGRSPVGVLEMIANQLVGLPFEEATKPEKNIIRILSIYEFVMIGEEGEVKRFLGRIKTK